jgi:hypothetical protein
VIRSRLFLFAALVFSLAGTATAQKKKAEPAKVPIPEAPASANPKIPGLYDTSSPEYAQRTALAERLARHGLRVEHYLPFVARTKGEADAELKKKMEAIDRDIAMATEFQMRDPRLLARERANAVRSLNSQYRKTFGANPKGSTPRTQPPKKSRKSRS